MRKYLLFIFCTLYTSAGIAQVVFQSFDLNPIGDSKPDNFNTIQNKLLFRAKHELLGTELFISDGTTPNTHLLKDIKSGFLGSSPTDFAKMNDKLYFTADDGAHGYELWVTDSTATGTYMIKDITAGSFGSVANKLTECNGLIYFEGHVDTLGFELWASNGIASGTNLVKNIAFGTAPCSLDFITPYNSKIYFQAKKDTATGVELWTSDGTAAGTYMVKDIIPGSGSGMTHLQSPRFTVCNGKLFFMATTNTNGTELWVTDGTEPGTRMVKDIRAAGNAFHISTFFGVYKNKIYFSASDGTNGYELWVSDGTEAGTYMLKDIWTGSGSSLPSNYIEYKNEFYFTARDSVYGNELWKTDGTTAGTVLVKDIRSGTDWSSPAGPIVYKEHLYFTALAENKDRHIFRSDGTAAGTQLIKPASATNINPLDSICNFTICDTLLFFRANYDNIGVELWMLSDTSVKTPPPGNVAAIQNIQSFTIYPNPTTGNFTIELNNTNFKNGTIAVYDIMGREVYKSQITNTKSQIFLNQPKGMYFIKLQLDDAVRTKQLTLD